MSLRGTKNFGLIFLFNLIVALFTVWMIVSYEYFRVSLIVFILGTALIGDLIFFNINRTNKIISIFTAFNGFGLLYTGYFFFQQILLNIEISQYKYFAMFLSFLSILVFDISYLLTKKKVEISGGTSRFSRSRSTCFFLVLVLLSSIAAEVYLLFIRIGIASYIAASRAQKSVLMSEYASVLTFYTFTIPLVCIIGLHQYLKYKDRYSAVITFVSLSIAILNSFISMSRAELISILLPVLYLYEKYGILSKKKTALLISAAFLLFGIWKSLFSSGGSVLYYDSEFSTWYKICENVLSQKMKPLYGKTYLDTIQNMVIPFTNTEPLSVWYMKNFEYDIWLRGGGRGFSAVLEAYMNFRVLGNIIVYSFYGWLNKQIQFNEDRDDDKSTIIYMIFLVSMFQFFRSESYSLWKNMMWFRIYPTLIILWMARHIASGKVKMQDGH